MSGKVKKTTDYPSAGTLNGAEILELVQTLVNVQTTLNAIAAFILPPTYPGQTSITSVGTITEGTWSGKFSPRAVAVTSGSSLTINSNITDLYFITALAADLTINASGTPSHGQRLMLRIKDAGVSKNLTFDAGKFRFSSSLTAPAATSAGKAIYLEFIYNSTVALWDCILKLDNF